MIRDLARIATLGVLLELDRALDAVLGRRCPLGCGQRVYPRDLTSHLHTEHAGDTP